MEGRPSREPPDESGLLCEERDPTQMKCKGKSEPLPGNEVENFEIIFMLDVTSPNLPLDISDFYIETKRYPKLGSPKKSSMI